MAKQDEIGRSHNRQIFRPKQGCQMAYFQTKNPNLGKFWRVLQWKMLLHFKALWSCLLPLGMVCGLLIYFMNMYLVHFFSFWYFAPRKI
jgi:sulfite exporter TauE/SafE